MAFIEFKQSVAFRSQGHQGFKRANGRGIPVLYVDKAIMWDWFPETLVLSQSVVRRESLEPTASRIGHKLRIDYAFHA